MKKLLVKIIFFLTPIISVIGIYEYLMFDLREVYTIPSVFQFQEKHNGLFMRKYLSQEFNSYKTFGIKKYNPKILIVGASRVMQFKGSYFNGSFYNAGGLIKNHKDLNTFLTTQNDADLILLGLNSFWFKEDLMKNVTSWIDYDIQEQDLTKSRYNPLKKMRLFQIISDYTSPRISNNIGANAQLKNGGFRLDGSMKITDERINLLTRENKFIDTEEPPVYKRIKEGMIKFSISKIDTAEFIHSAHLIKALVEQGKEVVVYLPPYSTQSYDLFKSTANQDYFFQFTTEFMPKKLSELGINYITTETPRDYNLDDTYFIDGFHPSEIFVAIQIEKHYNLFNRWGNYSLLNKSLNERYSNLLFNSSEMNTAPQ